MGSSVPSQGNVRIARRKIQLDSTTQESWNMKMINLKMGKIEIYPSLRVDPSFLISRDNGLGTRGSF